MLILLRLQLNSMHSRFGPCWWCATGSCLSLWPQGLPVLQFAAPLLPAVLQLMQARMQDLSNRVRQLQD